MHLMHWKKQEYLALQPDYCYDEDGARLICNYRSQVCASVARLFLILASAQSAGGVSPAEVHTACEKFLNQKAFPISFTSAGDRLLALYKELGGYLVHEVMAHDLIPLCIRVQVVRQQVRKVLWE